MKRISLFRWGGFYLIGGHGAKHGFRLLSSPLPLWERVAAMRWHRGRVRGLPPRIETPHPARISSAPPSPTRGEGKWRRQSSLLPRLQFPRLQREQLGALDQPRRLDGRLLGKIQFLDASGALFDLVG